MSDDHWKCMNGPWPSERPVRAQTLMSSLAADIGKVSLSFGDMQQTGAAWPLKKVVCTYDYTWHRRECGVQGSEHTPHLYQQMPAFHFRTQRGTHWSFSAMQ